MGQTTELSHSILEKDLDLDRRGLDNAPTPPWGQRQIPLEAIPPSLRGPQQPKPTIPLPQTKGHVPSFSEIVTVVQGRPGPPNSVVPPAPTLPRGPAQRPPPPSPATYNAPPAPRPPPPAANPYAMPRTPTLAFGLPGAGGAARPGTPAPRPSQPQPPVPSRADGVQPRPPPRAAPPPAMRRDTPPPETTQPADFAAQLEAELARDRPSAPRPPPPSPVAVARPAPPPVAQVIDDSGPMPDVTQPMVPAFKPDSFAPSAEDLGAPPSAPRAAVLAELEEPSPPPQRPPHDLSDLRPLPPVPEAQVPDTIPPHPYEEPEVARPAHATHAPSTPGGVHEIHARPAPLWRRLIAGIIDTSILGGVIGLFFFAAAGVVGLKAPSAGLTGLDALLARVVSWQPLMVPGAALAALLAVVYATAFGMLGRTPGRLLTGLRLVDKSGLAPAPGRAAFRAVLSIVSFALFLCGFWLALFDRRGQTLHDKLSSTFVVRPV